MIDKIINLIQPNKFKEELQNWYNGDEGKPKVIWSPMVLNKKVTSKWGNRWLRGEKQFHLGTDYTGLNNWIYAPCDCFVTGVREHDHEYPTLIPGVTPKGRAWTPWIELTAVHDMTLQFYPMHGEAVVHMGQMISGGLRVMEVGNYGNSTAQHVHIGVKKKGRWINPDKFFMKNIPGWGE